LSSTCREYAPAGTLGPAATNLTPSRARSCSLRILPGFAFGTMTTSRFRAKVAGRPDISPAWTRVSISFKLAGAYTPAGAPSSICDLSWLEPPKLNTTYTPPFLAEKLWAISWKASVREAAAYTVTSLSLLLLRDELAVFAGETEETDDGAAVPFPQAEIRRATMSVSAGKISVYLRIEKVISFPSPGHGAASGRSEISYVILQSC
jgi:hypothetical protein